MNGRIWLTPSRWVLKRDVVSVVMTRERVVHIRVRGVEAICLGSELIIPESLDWLLEGQPYALRHEAAREPSNNEAT